jgi:hypothetical protein
MFQKIILILVLALFSVKARAQPSQAISLLRELRKPLPDTSRGKLLLELGTHYIERVGEVTSDLDSALLFGQSLQCKYQSKCATLPLSDLRYC